MNDIELVHELIRVHFILLKINSHLASEQRTNHALKAVQFLIDEEIRRIAPEAED